MSRPIATVATLGLLTASCGESTSEAAVPTGSDAVTRVPGEIAGGVYQLSVLTVDDRCLEGALELVFKPNGGTDPYALQNPTTLPMAGALPSDGLIELEAPFSAMPVRWEAGDAGALVIIGGVISDVRLGIADSPDCTADLRIDVEVTPSGTGVDVDAAVTLSGVTSPTDTCPVIAEGCIVSLQLVGVTPGTSSR